MKREIITKASEPFVIASGTVFRCADRANEPENADVFVKDGKILSVVKHGEASFSGFKVIDAKDCFVTPGFIDAHSHSDMSLMAAPDAVGSIAQGITTEVIGNCGLSIFPSSDALLEHLASIYAVYNEKPLWHTIDEYAKEFDFRRPAVNAASLCGHNTIRAAVKGYADTPVTKADVEAMKGLLRSTLSAGACGISTGLLYVPGRFAGKEELSEVLSVMSGTKGVYATHLRSEGDRLEEAVEEAVFLANAGSNRLHVSHLKTAKKENFGKLASVLAMLEKARRNGMKVTVDRYPYTYSQTSLSIILPPPYDAMPDKEIVLRLKDDGNECCRLAEILKESQRDWSKTVFVSTSLEGYEKIKGLNFADAAKKLGTTPWELALRIISLDSPSAMAAFGGLSEENMKKIVALPYACCGRDESTRRIDGSFGRSHPRGFGSMPEFLSTASKMTSYGDAIYRMCRLPAEIFSLEGRGVLEAGAAADVVIFDPEKFKAASTFAEPHKVPEGVKAVFVNGIRSYSYEEGLTARAGRFIRQTRR